LEEIFREQGKEIEDLKKQLEEKIVAKKQLQANLEKEIQQNKVRSQTVNKTNYLDEECSHFRNQIEALDALFYQLEYRNQNATELLEYINDNLLVLTEKILLSQKRVESEKARLQQVEGNSKETNDILKKDIQDLQTANDVLEKKLTENSTQAKASFSTEKLSKKNLRAVQHQLIDVSDALEQSNLAIRALKAKIDTVKRVNM